MHYMKRRDFITLLAARRHGRSRRARSGRQSNRNQFSVDRIGGEAAGTAMRNGAHRQAVSRALAVLVNPAQAINTESTLQEVQARHLRLWMTMNKEGAGAVVIQGSLSTKDVADLALQHRLPAATVPRAFAEVGGLMSYGTVGPDSFRQSAGYVIKILRGAKPADMPVQQPTKFELVINLKTAKALGISVPPTLIARTDEVIEWGDARSSRSNGSGRSVARRAVHSFLHFELPDECSEPRGDGSCDSVVLIHEALPDCRQRNASIASGTQLALRGMRSVTILNDMPTNPIVDSVGCSNRGGEITL
jgi:hypothetical protein